MMDLIFDTSTDLDTCNQCGVALHEHETNVCASCEWTEDEMIIARGEDREEDFDALGTQRRPVQIEVWSA
jgi:uncharacterized Zn finger protein (UPF0148 family)